MKNFFKTILLCEEGWTSWSTVMVILVGMCFLLTGGCSATMMENGATYSMESGVFVSCDSVQLIQQDDNNYHRGIGWYRNHYVMVSSTDIHWHSGWCCSVLCKEHHFLEGVKEIKIVPCEVDTVYLQDSKRFRLKIHKHF